MSSHLKILQHIVKQEKNIPKMELSVKKLQTKINNVNPSEQADIYKDLEEEIKDIQKHIQHIKKKKMQYLKREAYLLFHYLDQPKPAFSLKSLGKRLNNPKRDFLLNQYRLLTEPDFKWSDPYFRDQSAFCLDCHKLLVEADDDGKRFCPKCHHVYDWVNTQIDKEEPTSNFLYKRVDHFTEWLYAIQGRQPQNIKERIIDLVRIDLDRLKIPNHKLTAQHVAASLKKRKLPAYYQHSFKILHIITKQEPIRLSFDNEQTLIAMFKEIQEPFDLFKGERINFPSYPYLIYRLFQILDIPYLKQIEPFAKKSVPTLRVLDHIWAKICKYRGWSFKGM